MPESNKDKNKSEILKSKRNLTAIWMIIIIVSLAVGLGRNTRKKAKRNLTMIVIG